MVDVNARIDISAPATISLTGTLQSALPPGAITITDPADGTIAVTLTTSNAAASLSASSIGGATVSTNVNTLTITGAAAQVNAALASLALTEQAGAITDTILLTATDPAALPAQRDIAVNIAATTGPAFAAPPTSLNLQAYALNPITGLVLGDPEATALAAAGQGALETLQITLSAASGIMFLPGLTALSGISALGIGTGTILLTFSADQLAAVNTLLAGLVYAAPAAISGLAYAMRDLSGPLGAASTSGNIVLDITGAQPPPSTITTGADTAILGPATLAATLTISGAVSDLGGITGTGAIAIAPDASFAAPYNTISLGGTSFDFGTLTAASLAESGALIIGNGAAFGGPINLGSNGIIDFSGTLTAGADAQSTGQIEISLAQNAVISGSGTIIAGNFSESGDISGPGTILAGGGETLLLAADSITGDTNLEVGAGGVIVLGPLSPLYGVFNVIPLTIAQGVTLGFLAQSGGQPAIGAFADTLAQSGGVFVIDSPGVFAGTITGFAPGDRLIFPGLTGLTLLSITGNSFVVAGNDSNNITQSYTINATTPSGTQLYVGTDQEGDGEVGLRDAGPDIFINGATASLYAIVAKDGVSQPIQAIDVLPPFWTGQSLSLTLSVSAGLLSDPGFTPSSSLTITAASPTALNAALSGLAYTGNPDVITDTLLISSSNGLLAGLSDAIPIYLNTLSGTLSGFYESGIAALFTGNNPTPLTGAAAPGEIVITGGEDIFSDLLTISSLSGTALLLDASATAIFDPGANVNLVADMTIVQGQLDVLTNAFTSNGNLTLANGGADISGALDLSGSLAIAGGNFQLPGTLNAASLTIAPAGAFTATATASAVFIVLTDSGTISFFDAASGSAGSANMNGTLVLGGTSRLDVQNAITTTGAITIGPDAALQATTFSQHGGTISLAGLLVLGTGMSASGAISLAGGTIIAPAITLGPSASLTGFGDIQAPSGLGTLAATNAKITATGALIIGDNTSLAGTSGIAIGTLASLDVAHALTGGSIDFTGGGAALTINDLAAFTAPVLNMLDDDAIDLIGISPALVSLSSGSLTARDANGNLIGGFDLSIASAQPALNIASDGHGGTLLTLNGDMPCFARGTRLLTPDGYRPVETFKPGDPIITLAGVSRAISWIGRRTLDLTHTEASPVRFDAHSISPGIPKRPVLLSPLHAVFLEGALIPALHLVNGATITREPAAAITYFHIELDRHDVIFADGMAAETYLDTGNRGHLYHEQGIRCTARTPCAPLVTAGPSLAAIRRRLHRIALDAGYTLTYYPGLRGAAAQTSLLPKIRMNNGRRIARFALPENAAKLALAARSATPADTNPDSEDRRSLGICLERIAARGKTLPLDRHLGPGWHRRALDDTGIWMGGAGMLVNLPSGIGAVTLSLSAIIQSWQPPQLDLNLTAA